MNDEGVQKGKIPPCRIGYLISVSNRDTNKSRVPNTFWTPSLQENDRPICLRDTLLPKLMSGKLKIKEIEAKLDGQTNC